MRKSKVIILAGGKGTRLESVNANNPKSLALLNGKSVLEHIVTNLKNCGFVDVHLALGYRASAVIEALPDLTKRTGVNFTYHIETEQLGTVNAICESLQYLDDDFLVVYGDTVINIAINAFYLKHLNSKYLCNVLTHPSSHPGDADLVEADGDKIKCVHRYPHPKNTYYENVGLAAMYAFSKTCFEGDRFCGDISKDFIPYLIKNFHDVGYVRTTEYIKDMGTPKRLKAIEAELKKGLPELMSSKKARPAIFWDRDGTIVKNVAYNVDVSRVEFFEGILSAIKYSTDAGYLNFIVTNQPVIARGEATFHEVENINNYIEWKIADYGGLIEKTVYCPHHPDSGFEGEIKNLKCVCNCRKPATGLINGICNDYHISLKDSLVIGDSYADYLLANNLNLRFISVANENFSECADTVKTRNLKQALTRILD